MRCGYLLFLVEIRNISIRQTGSGINPHHCSSGKISLMSNISKMVRDTLLDSWEVRYETTNGLSIGTTTFNLGWPWTRTVQDHPGSKFNRIESKARWWFPIWPPFSQTSHLSPFSRYLTLKILFIGAMVRINSTSGLTNRHISDFHQKQQVTTITTSPGTLS